MQSLTCHHRTYGCAYLTALMAMTANIVHAPFGSDHIADGHLIEAGLATSKPVLDASGVVKLQEFHALCSDLKTTFLLRRNIVDGLAGYA